MSGLKGKIVLVKDPQGAVHQMSTQNANDMVMHRGWEMVGDMPADVCDACMGTGRFPVDSKEVCWHCEGEGLDPTK